MDIQNIPDAEFRDRLVASPNGCWEYSGYRDKKGYGRLRRVKYSSSPMGAHRYSWVLKNGPIPDGTHVLHKCDNPSCCNPSHLFLGSNIDNVADMVSKGRHRPPFRKMSGVAGENNPAAKLTIGDVEEIRRMGGTGKYTQTEIGAKFGVARSTVSQILRGRLWVSKSVDPPQG